jgi:hypothetical protein
MEQKDKIDEKFDKAEKVVQRTQALLIKAIGALVAIGLAVYVGLDQLGGSDEEYYDEPIEEGYYEFDSIPEDSIYYGEEQEEI